MLALLLPTTLVALFLPAPQCGAIYLHHRRDAFFQLVLRYFGGYGGYSAELYDEALGAGSAYLHECAFDAFEGTGGDACEGAACGGELVGGEEERIADA